MNTQDRIPPIDETHWQAQEKARRGDADADVDDLRIARVLRQAPPIDLPPDFAARVATLALSRAASASLLEQRLLRGLVVVFALSAAVVVGWYGRGWPSALAGVLPGGTDAVHWSIAAGFCVAANWGFGVLRRSLAQPRGTTT